MAPPCENGGAAAADCTESSAPTYDPSVGVEDAMGIATKSKPIVTNSANSSQREPLLRGHLPRPTEFLREILELRKTVFHRQDRLLIVHMNPRLELQVRNRRGKHIDQSQWRMARQQMAAAELTILPVADLGLMVFADMLSAFGDLYRLGLP